MASGSGRGSTCISRYLQEIREYPILTREDEVAAARRLHGSAAGPPDYQALDAILALKSREVSLDDRVGRETDAPISDYLTDERSPNPEDELILTRSSGAKERCGRAAGSPAMYALRARARAAASSGQAGTVSA